MTSDRDRPLVVRLDAVRRFPGRTGTDRFLVNLLRELVRLDTANRYVVRCRRGDREVVSAVRGGNVVVAETGHGRWREQLPLPRGEGGRPDVAFSFRNLDAPRPPARRTLLAVHDLAPVATPYYHPRRLRREAARRLAERSIRRADGFLAVSEFSKRELVDRYDVPSEAVTVAREAADPAFRPVTVAEGASVRARLRLPNRYVLVAGGSDPRKNVETVVAAHARMRIRVPLVVFGPRWHGRDLDAPAGSRDVLWLGPVAGPDLPAVYSLADAFVFLSLYEGFGLPPLEAMACGTPVVCSGTTALPETVGDAGILVDPLDTDRTAAELDRLLADERHRSELVARGREHAASFGWDDTARALIAALDRAARQPRPRR